MHRILEVNTYTSGSILIFVQSYHKYSDIFMNMSQITSTCVRECQLTPDYIRAKYARMIEYLSGACLITRVRNALLVQ